MVRKPLTLPVALLLFAALLFVSCDGDLSGNYSMSVNMTLDCRGEQQQAQEGFDIKIEADNGNITVSPSSPGLTNLLSGTGTMTTSEISFTGDARTKAGSSKAFKFQGNFKGTKSDASYSGEVSNVTGTYGDCQIVKISFVLTKQ